MHTMPLPNEKPSGKNRYSKQLRSRVRKLTRSQREQIGLMYHFMNMDVKSLAANYNVSPSWVYKLVKDFGNLSREMIGEILTDHPEILSVLKEQHPEAYLQVIGWYPKLADCASDSSASDSTAEPADSAPETPLADSASDGALMSEEALLRLILSLALEEESSAEKISIVLKNTFGMDLSRSSIDEIINQIGKLAADANKRYDCIVMPKVKAVALDEIFTSGGDPILTVIDLDSTYVLAISPQDDRKKETWEALLLCLKEDCGLNPELFISDECGCILLACESAYEEAHVLLDIFHILKDLWDSGKHCSRKYQKYLTDLEEIEEKVNAGVRINKNTMAKWEKLLEIESEVRTALESLEILRKWISELLGYTGYTPGEVKELLCFCMDELAILAGTAKNVDKERSAHWSVIGDIRYTKFGAAIDKFCDKTDRIMGYLEFFWEKLGETATANNVKLELLEQAYRLRRFAYGSEAYNRAAAIARKQFRCGEMELSQARELVDNLVASSKRSSSLIENLNSRIRVVLNSKKKVSDAFFELLRLYINCREYPRSRVKERQHKSPIELATGEKVSFFELLGINPAKATATPKIHIPVA